MKLTGACNITIKGTQYTRYELTTFMWDLKTRDVNIVVLFTNDIMGSYSQKYTFTKMKEEILINDLLNKVHNQILKCS